MPLVYQDTIRGDARNPLTIPSPNSDVMTEQFAQTFEENPIKAFQRWNELREDQKTGPMLQADAARQKLKDAGLENDLNVSDAGITQAALDTLMFRKGIEKRRQETFARAEGGLAQGAARLGLSLATTLADPISAGLNFVPVVGQARYARWLAEGGSIAGRVGVRAGVGAAEGVAGAALVEPFIYGMRTQEQADYDAVDSLMNVALGGVVGSGLHVTVGSLGELIARRMPSKEPAPRVSDIVDAMSSEAQHAALRAAVGQAVEGRPIDVDGIVRAATAIPEEERLIARQINEALGQREANLRKVTEGQDGQAVALLRNDDTEARLAQVVAGRDADAAILRESVQAQVEAEAQRLAKADNVNAYAIARSRERGAPDTVFEKWKRRAQENVEKSRDDAVVRLDKANKLIESMRGVVDRRNQVRSAETDLEQLSYLRNSAKSIDDLVAALPQDQQAGFRRRIAVGRREGYVRGPGSKLTDASEGRVIAAREPAANEEYLAATKQAEATLAREVENTTEANLKAAEEEADLAVAEAKELADRLGLKMDEDADIAAINEAAEKAERWARAAELATVCLTRGG